MILCELAAAHLDVSDDLRPFGPLAGDWGLLGPVALHYLGRSPSEMAWASRWVGSLHSLAARPGNRRGSKDDLVLRAAVVGWVTVRYAAATILALYQLPPRMPR